MTRKIAKAVLSFVMILFLLFLNLFGVGDYLYPDNASLFEGEKLESVLCFSCKTATDQEERVLAFGIIPIKDVSVTFYENREVLCGGDLFGIRMELLGCRCELDFAGYKDFYVRYYTPRAEKYVQPVREEP